MEFSTEYASRTDLIETLFRAMFTASEGIAEGTLVGGLAKSLLASTKSSDVYVFSAIEGNTLLGCIIFTRMTFDNDKRTVFVLSPVAIKSEMQNQGVGQQLLNYGINCLHAEGVDVVLTYGDIKFYSKVGFEVIDEDFAKPPFPLKYPHGWLGQSLDCKPFEPLRGASHCVDALQKPEFW